jgi:hypothetical protein
MQWKDVDINKGQTRNHTCPECHKKFKPTDKVSRDYNDLLYHSDCWEQHDKKYQLI